MLSISGLLVAFVLQGEVLVPGEEVSGTVDPREATTVRSPGLDALSVQKLARGVPFTLEAEAGTWTIEMSSRVFDPYLVVRDGKGELVSEDNDGLGRDNARILLEVPEGGATYTVWACATRGMSGEFELRLVAGDAPLPDPNRRVEDPRAFVDSEWIKHGLGERDAVACIFYRGTEHRSRRDYDTAIEIGEYALLTLDPSNPDHRFAKAHFYKLLLLVLPSAGRRAEAVELGLRAAELLATMPEADKDQAFYFTLAYELWPTARFAEGLPAAERAFAMVEQAGYPPTALEYRRARVLLQSYQRVMGLWEDALADLPDPIELRPGTPLESSLELNVCGYQITEILDHDYSQAHTRCHSLPFVVKESGEYTIDMRSFVYDTYLVLRAEDGTLLAEDDDGRGLRNSRIVTRLDANEVYILEPTALHGGFGDYRVDLIRGRPEEVDEWEQRNRMLEEIEECRLAIESWPPDRRRNGLVNALRHMAELQSVLGRTSDVVSTRKADLELMHELYGPESRAALSASYRYGSALRAADRSLEAIPILEEVRDEYVRRSGPQSVPADLHQSLATALADRGDYERADELYREHQAIIEREFGRESSIYIRTLRSRGLLFWRMRRLEEATEMTRQVVDWYEAKGTRDVPGARHLLAGALDDLAFLLAWTEGLETARRTREDTLALQELTFGENSFAAAKSRSELAWILHRQGELKQAWAEWQRAGAIYEAQGSEWSNHSLFGAEILASLDEPERGLELALGTLDRKTRLLASTLASLPEPLRLREAEKIHWHRGAVLGLGRLVPGSERRVYERIAQLKRLVGRGLLESRARAQSALDPESRAALNELRNVQSELAKAFHEGKERLVERLRRRRVELEDVIARSSASSNGRIEVRVGELAAALPEGSVFVDLYLTAEFEPVSVDEGELDAPRWWEGERASAWIVRAGVDRVSRVDLGPSEALRRAAADPSGARLGARGVAPASSQGASDTRDELRRLLWDPIAPHVGDATRVFVSTYGFLGSVPFEVLQLEDGRFLIEDRAFVYVPDAAQLLEPAPPEVDEAPGLLLVGDVDYDRPEFGQLLARADEIREATTGALRARTTGGWSPLPFTRSEVARLAGLFADSGEVVELMGPHATEEALKRELPHHRYVHVATHGFFLADENATRRAGQGALAGIQEGVAGLLPGLLSGLVLAGANAEPERGREDGLLTAEELTWLNLSDCELVTLSACETGLGSERGGEGMIGLRRAFHLAGARTVVASLWSVEDEATARLMSSFYRYLWAEGVPRGEALRAAQLDLLQSNRELFGEPRPWTWGAFVLSGEWR